MRQLSGVVLLLVGLALPALAEAPDVSLRPVPRPAIGAPPVPLDQQAARLTGATSGPVARAAAGVAAPASAPRPMPRPALPAAVADQRPTPQLPTTVVAAGFLAAPASRSVLASVPRPLARPALARVAPRQAAEPDAPAEAELVPAAAPRIDPGRSAVVGRKGSVCGVRGIQGETLAPVTARTRGCGIDKPVRVTSVDGVRLSTPATIDCDTARALNDWVRGALKPAFGRTGVAELQVAAAYACRSRNNVRGAPISEHGRGKAIDISAVVLENGRRVSVLEDWRNRSGRPLVKAYRAACGTFGTTLGPDSDRHHRDHIHFDTARHRGGPYCR
jgi:hypothetical protein